MNTPKNREPRVEDLWYKTVQGQKVPTRRHGRGNRRWRVRYVDDKGCEHAPAFEREIDAQRWIDEEIVPISIAEIGGTVTVTTTKTGVFLYHDMRKHDDFGTTAQALFDLVQCTARKYPGKPRHLYLDIEDHRNSAGGYDADACEILGNFMQEFLGQYLSRFPTIGARMRNPNQSEDIPETLTIQGSPDLSSWPEAVLSSLRSYCQKNATSTIERQAFIDEEMPSIRAATKTRGATPEQTLGRILQELRDAGIIEFLSPGRYRLTDQTPSSPEGGAMTVPTIDALLRPILLAVEGDIPKTRAEIRAIVAAAVNLSDEDRLVLTKGGKETVWQSNMGWAITYLNHSGLLEKKASTGKQYGTQYALTELGQTILAEHPQITERVLRQAGVWREPSKATTTPAPPDPASHTKPDTKYVGSMNSQPPVNPEQILVAALKAIRAVDGFRGSAERARELADHALSDYEAARRHPFSNGKVSRKAGGGFATSDSR